MALFRDRPEAGRKLGELLSSSVAEQNVLVLGLPRGGVPVAFEVARALHGELDIFLVRKLGMPGEKELALGAIASGGVRVLNRDLIAYLRVAENVIEEITARERAELERQERMLRKGGHPISPAGRTVVVVDDGLATGASMLAATRALRPLGAKKIIVAVPVGAKRTCNELQSEADEVVCAATPGRFTAVGAWYDDFSQVSDEEVRNLLQQAAHEAVA